MEGTERRRCVDVPLEDGAVVRVETVAEATFRIRLSSDGAFPEPSLVRGIRHMPLHAVGAVEPDRELAAFR